jgi:hypothetical protein
MDTPQFRIVRNQMVCKAVCSVCSGRADPDSGPEIFGRTSDGVWGPVCFRCQREHAPEMVLQKAQLVARWEELLNRNHRDHRVKPRKLFGKPIPLIGDPWGPFRYDPVLSALPSSREVNKLPHATPRPD